ncbi:hypothetical protein G6F57_022432 [Rhizopus arrhizus]|nr:hypothetical protein G6F35_018067 [Rhizopus arrhizus]KAG1433084.1 hypothetical protein G6F57_022432 [Rhizopus arrhizus]
MHHAVVLTHAVQLAAIRLDLFQLVGYRVVAAGPRRPVTTAWPAIPSSPVGAGVKRKSRSPARAVNSHSARTATA